jgi:hypothetical protein
MYDGTACLAPGCASTAIGEYGIFLCEVHAVKAYVRITRLARDRGWNMRKATEQSERKRAEESLAARHAQRHGYERAEQVVYFALFGERIKIGTTTNPARRLANLPYEEILCVIPGDRTTEREMHRRFAAHRIQGEWFHDCQEIRAYIAEAKRSAA